MSKKRGKRRLRTSARDDDWADVFAKPLGVGIMRVSAAGASAMMYWGPFLRISLCCPHELLGKGVNDKRDEQ